MVRARAQRRGRMPHVCAGKPSLDQPPMKSKHLYKGKDWQFQTWVFPKPNGTPKSSILIIGFSMKFSPSILGVFNPPYFWFNTHIIFFWGGVRLSNFRGGVPPGISNAPKPATGVRWGSAGHCMGKVGLLV